MGFAVEGLGPRLVTVEVLTDTETEDGGPAGTSWQIRCSDATWIYPCLASKSIYIYIHR